MLYASRTNQKKQYIQYFPPGSLHCMSSLPNQYVLICTNLSYEFFKLMPHTLHSSQNKLREIQRLLYTVYAVHTHPLSCPWLSLSVSSLYLLQSMASFWHVSFLKGRHSISALLFPLPYSPCFASSLLFMTNSPSHNPLPSCSQQCSAPLLPKPHGPCLDQDQAYSSLSTIHNIRSRCLLSPYQSIIIFSASFTCPCPWSAHTLLLLPSYH